MEQAIAFLFMSNQDDALTLDEGDRRYLVLKTIATVHKDGPAYYDALYGKSGVGGVLNDPKLLGAILWKLLHRDLGNYTIEGPAPLTVAKVEMIHAAMPEVQQWVVRNKDVAPLRYRAVTIDEVVEALPQHLRGRGASKAVQKALKDHLGGKSVGQIWPDGRKSDKISVWMLHGLDATLLTDGEVSKMYRDDRAQARKEAGSGEEFDIP
jgi:hypothetical protein